jgi:hypothetical protein
VKGSTESIRLQPPVRRSASSSTNHITYPAQMMVRGGSPNSQPISAASRMLSMRWNEATAVPANSSTSYQGMRVADALGPPGKIRKVKGSMQKMSR